MWISYEKSFLKISFEIFKWNSLHMNFTKICSTNLYRMHLTLKFTLHKFTITFPHVKFMRVLSSL